jgi:hypothetical protein
MQGLGESEDHGEESMRQTGSVLHLEPCRQCKGEGNLGMIGGHIITCGHCMGSRLMWIERCALLPLES